jgi:hypothetical protein
MNWCAFKAVQYLHLRKCFHFINHNDIIIITITPPFPLFQLSKQRMLEALGVVMLTRNEVLSPLYVTSCCRSLTLHRNGTDPCSGSQWCVIEVNVRFETPYSQFACQDVDNSPISVDIYNETSWLYRVFRKWGTEIWHNYRQTSVPQCTMFNLNNLLLGGSRCWASTVALR